MKRTTTLIFATFAVLAGFAGTEALEVETFGYGVGEQHPPRRPPADAIHLTMNVHGFLLREFGGTDEYYQTYADKIKSNGYTYAFDPQQNSNPETSYFRGMILRLVRTIQYTKSLPEWDGKDLRGEWPRIKFDVLS